MRMRRLSSRIPSSSRDVPTTDRLLQRHQASLSIQVCMPVPSTSHSVWCLYLGGRSSNCVELFLSVVRDPRAPTTRSQSLYEPLRGVSAFGGGGSTSGSTSGGSITSGQPLIRGNDASRGLTCAFCQLRFANEPSLQVKREI